MTVFQIIDVKNIDLNAYYKLKGVVIFIKNAIYLLLSQWESMTDFVKSLDSQSAGPISSSAPIQILNNAWIANSLPPAISISEYPDCFAPHKVIKDSLALFE